AVAVEQAGGGELGAGEGVRAAVGLALVIRRDGQQGGVDRELAVHIADGVVGKSRTNCGAGGDGIGAARHGGGGGGTGAGQRRAGDAVAVEQAGGGELGAGEGVRAAVGLALVIRRDGQQGGV